MSLKSLSNYTVYAKYAHYLPEKKRRETWDEITDRVFAMHARKYATQLEKSEEFRKDFEFAREMVRKKRVLGSQRALQFGGRWIEDKNLRLFNCATTHVNRARAFQEIMFTLLCGTGMGFSVQKQHVKNLPDIQAVKSEFKTFIIPDTIEGWADSVGVLLSSFFVMDGEFSEFLGRTVVFDYSLIRPEGALIAGQFKAPGNEGLKKALENIRRLIQNRLKSEAFKTDEFAGKLRPIDAYDIVMFASDAVLSGGVRRSATICIFSPDDSEMISAKTGNWLMTNPQRARSNNSAALLKGQTSRERFHSLMESTQQFGEPGFIWLENLDIVFNPCCEIGMIPVLDGESGVQVCNLVEINGKYCDSKERFNECCRAAGIIGTIQAGYTNFKYLTEVSKRICDKEALLGCSITGIMDNPHILLDKTIQQEGARTVLKTNERVAKIIGVNPTARATCVKPAGSTSCVLETSSGIHPHHAKRYIRRVQANRNEFSLEFYRQHNPDAIEPSVWSANGTDDVIAFTCEVPKGAKLKNDIGAIDFLSQINLTQNNWVEYGTRPELCTDERMRHNVSCTVVVKDEAEWRAVEEYIFKNQRSFAGISLLSSSGDLDYPQAPFATVLTPEEIVREYGDGSILASGLVVDGLHAFSDNLWAACDAALGINTLDEKTEPIHPRKPTRKGFKTEKAYTTALADYAIELNLFYQEMGDYQQNAAKTDWIRRAKQFADRHFNADLRRATYCLKHVSLWHTWLKIKRNHKEIDWSQAVEDHQDYVAADTLAAAACHGGSCEIK